MQTSHTGAGEGVGEEGSGATAGDTGAARESGSGRTGGATAAG